MLDVGGALELLRTGEINVEGQLIDASNATLFATIRHEGTVATCVYKPVAGERPLWDFPDGTLAGREYAAWLVSEHSGWDVVPPTVLRDGPFGRGMVQLWIDIDETVDLVEFARSDDPGLRRMAVFDAVVNNADRKGGHLLPTPAGHTYGVDHGLTFHSEDKLRTLLWRWRGLPLTAEAVAVLTRLRDGLRAGELVDALERLLTRRELAALRARVERLLTSGVHPQPSEDWPAIPWPPF